MTINQSMQLAVQHHRAGRFAEAEMICRQVFAQAPDYFDALHLLGVLAGQSGHTDDAISLLSRAVGLRPGFEAYSNLGVALRENGQLDAAIDAHRNALRLNPDYADAWRNLGVALNAMRLFDEAMSAFDRALQIKPDFAHVHFNRGVLWLLRGDFQNGWPEYEWRWKLPSQVIRPPRPRPMERRGAARTDHPALRRAGDRRHAAICSLRPPGRAAWRATSSSNASPSYCRCWRVSREYNRSPRPARRCRRSIGIALLSLPLTFATDLGSIPREVPYITADPLLVEQWRDRLGLASGFKVGLVWAGKADDRNDRIRSIDFSQLSPLWGIPGVHFFSLQKGQAKPGHSPAQHWVDWTDDLHDFAQTAALIANLDMVITVDTAVAHLAGAMGKPVWVLLPFVPDWRWLLDREDSPWYPTMRLFRQSAPNDWPCVIARVAEQLHQRV